MNPPAPGPLRSAWNTQVGGLPRTYWLLWWGTFVNRLGTFAVPFLAIYLTGERGLSKAEAGAVASLHGLGALLAAPLGGMLADRLGRRTTLVGALLAGAGSLVLLALVRAPPLIALAVFLLGLLGELFRPAVSAAIADVVPPERRAQAFTLLYWVINLGFAMAMPLAGLLSGVGFVWLFLGDAATTLLYAVLVFLRLPETRPPEAVAAAARGGGGWRSYLPSLAPFRDPAFLAFALPVLLLALVFFQHLMALPLTLEARGMDARTWGQVLATNGVLIVLLQPFVGGWVRGVRRGTVLALACALAGLGFGLHGLPGGVGLAVLAVGVWTVGEILHAPVASSVVADLAPAHARGTYQGAFHMLWGVAAFLGPLVGGWVLEHAPAGSLWAGCAGVGLAAAGLQLAAAQVRRRQLQGVSVALD